MLYDSAHPIVKLRAQCFLGGTQSPESKPQGEENWLHTIQPITGDTSGLTVSFFLILMQQAWYMDILHRLDHCDTKILQETGVKNLTLRIIVFISKSYLSLFLSIIYFFPVVPSSSLIYFLSTAAY